MREQYSQPVSSFRWLAITLVSATVAFGAGLVSGKSQINTATAQAPFVNSSSGTITGLETSAPSDVKTPVDFQEFWDLWRLLKQHYYKQPVSDAQLFYGAMTGLADSLKDPYTTYFDAHSAGEFSQSLQGKFEGIGAEIGLKDDQLQIIAPLPGTPADTAGLRAGDFILSIDKKDTSHMSVDEAVSLIRGPRGTKVLLNIGRIRTEKDAKGKTKQTLIPQDFSITRQIITVKSVRVKYLRDGIADIEITHFNEDTLPLFKDAVSEILSKNTKGLIVDLRNDPGGYLDRATGVASEWVGDQVVVMERQQGKITDTYHGTESARLKDLPTIILVNQGSASAAEIVAGALQDYRKAKLVGMKTFGKGSVQNYIDFPDKSAVKITIAEWLTPKGRSIDKIGIQPDIEVDLTLDDVHANRDPQLDKALEILTGKPSAPPKAANRAQK